MPMVAAARHLLIAGAVAVAVAVTVVMIMAVAVVRVPVAAQDEEDQRVDQDPHQRQNKHHCTSPIQGSTIQGLRRCWHKGV